LALWASGTEGGLLVVMASSPFKLWLELKRGGAEISPAEYAARLCGIHLRL